MPASWDRETCTCCAPSASALAARFQTVLDVSPHARTRVGTWKVAILGLGALAALGVGAFLSRTPLQRWVHGPPSIAVLPLANRTGDPSQEYFSDGMTEELIGRLAQVGDLRVISRS